MRGRPLVPGFLRTLLKESHTYAQLQAKLPHWGWSVKPLGSGMFRTAYLVRRGRQRFVVKEFYRYTSRFPTNPLIFRAPFTKVGRWEVQHHYRQATYSRRMRPVWDVVCTLKGDLCVNNSGYDVDGTLIAFDW